MSYEKIKELIDINGGEYYPFDKNEIRKCESELNLIFAKPFKNFLLEIGSMTVGSIELYEGHSDGLISHTEDLREFFPNIPNSFIALTGDGFGDSWAYDNAKNKVFILSHEDRHSYAPKISHNTIEEFLEDIIENS